MHKPSATLLIGVCVMFLTCESAIAQTSEATSFEQLQVLLKPGDTVTVIDSTGAPTRGRIGQLSTSLLQLRVNGNLRDLKESDIREIRRRQSDSLGNGAIIGAAIGGGFMAIPAIGCARSDGFLSCTGADALAIIGIGAGLGAGIGVAVDALRIPTRTIFKSPSRASLERFRFAPVISSTRKGVAVAFSF